MFLHSACPTGILHVGVELRVCRRKRLSARQKKIGEGAEEEDFPQPTRSGSCLSFSAFFRAEMAAAEPGFSWDKPPFDTFLSLKRICPGGFPLPPALSFLLFKPAPVCALRGL
jgi:hypothetical protein